MSAIYPTRSQDQLTQTFAEYGTIKQVQLLKDRETGRLQGFAFVEMGTEAEEAAELEMTVLSGWVAT